ncbi:MAG: cell division protein CrgA [Frankiaceae bacterium]
MPKSRVRRKPAYTPPPTRSGRKARGAPWVGPAMGIFFLIGIAWLVVYYITGSNIPVFDTLGNWNLLVGFGLICIGFGLATKWQ